MTFPSQQQSAEYLDYLNKAKQCADDNSKCAEIAAWKGAEALATAAGVDPAIARSASACAQSQDVEACARTAVTGAATAGCIALTAGAATLACGPAAGFLVDTAWPAIKEIVTDPVGALQWGLDTLGVSAKAKFDWYNVPDSVVPPFAESFRNLASALQNAWVEGRKRLNLPAKQFEWAWCEDTNGCMVPSGSGIVNTAATSDPYRWDKESLSEKQAGGDFWSFWKLLHDKTSEAWVEMYGDGFWVKDNPTSADSGRHWGVNPQEFPFGFTFKKEPTPVASSVRVSQQSLQALYRDNTMVAAMEGFKKALTLIAKRNAEEYATKYGPLLNVSASKLAASAKMVTPLMTLVRENARRASVSRIANASTALKGRGVSVSLTKLAAPGGLTKASTRRNIGALHLIAPAAWYERKEVQIGAAVAAVAVAVAAVIHFTRDK